MLSRAATGDVMRGLSDDRLSSPEMPLVNDSDENVVAAKALQEKLSNPAKYESSLRGAYLLCPVCDRVEYCKSYDSNTGVGQLECGHSRRRKL